MLVLPWAGQGVHTCNSTQGQCSPPPCAGCAYAPVHRQYSLCILHCGPTHNVRRPCETDPQCTARACPPDRCTCQSHIEGTLTALTVAFSGPSLPLGSAPFPVHHGRNCQWWIDTLTRSHCDTWRACHCNHLMVACPACSCVPLHPCYHHTVQVTCQPHVSALHAWWTRMPTDSALGWLLCL